MVSIAPVYALKPVAQSAESSGLEPGVDVELDECLLHDQLEFATLPSAHMRDILKAQRL